MSEPASSSLPAVLPPEGADPAVVPLCHNCGVPAAGKFCSNCGQSTAVHMPTLMEFLHEFVSHHIAIEGTLFESLKRLLLSPGGLTLDYFAGKRARYVAPLRLYLTFNVIFFLALEVAQLFGPGVDADAKKALAQLNTQEASTAIDQAAKEIDNDPDLTPDQRRIASDKLALLKAFAAHAAIPGPAVVTSSQAPVAQEHAPTSVSSVLPAPPQASGSSVPPAQSTAAPTAATSSVVVPAVNSAAKDDDDDDDQFGKAIEKVADQADEESDAKTEVLESVKNAIADSGRPLDRPMTQSARDNYKPSSQLEGFKQFEDKIIPAWVDQHAPAVRRHLDQIPQRSGAETRQRLKDNILRYAPYTLLALVPVCAFLLQLSFIFCHRGYVENLVSSLHGHTFLFIVLLVFLLPLGGLLSTIWIVLALIHMIWALSRIYGSKGFGLFLRLGFLAVTYSVAFAIATSLAVIASVIT